MDIRKLQRAIVDGLEDVKAQDIVVFNTERLSPLFERVIIASGTSNRQTKALASSVRQTVKGRGLAVMSTEGEANGEWIIVDCGAAVAHIMQPEIRRYYHLEEIWGGKPVKLKLTEGKGLPKAGQAAPASPGSARRSGPESGAAAKAPATKAPAAKAPATKAPAGKAPATKAPAKKTPVKKTPAKKRPAKKTPALPAPAPAQGAAGQAAPAQGTAVKRTAAKRTAAKGAPVQRRPSKTTAPKRPASNASPGAGGSAGRPAGAKKTGAGKSATPPRRAA
ncbi:MAG: ribosome silencing factor, partial [Proteobacteria bacterium]|nr:ribosome silencing factor [Pseudomonadota bacterium]